MNAEDKTTDEVLEGIDLTGKRAIVTGATGGIGEETARALAAKGAAVTITGRNVPKAESVVERIRKTTGNDNVDFIEMELSVPDSVRSAAATFVERHDCLHILVNNAGVMACPLERTAEDWEMQLATNHIGHFLFTCLLADLLRKSAPARVVNVSSVGHKYCGFDFDDPHFEFRPYDAGKAYGQSKTANTLFTVELNKRLGPFGVTSYSLHPGSIETDLGRHMSKEAMEQTLALAEVNHAFRIKTIPQGAATSVWAATSPELEGHGGAYLEDCALTEENELGLRAGGRAPWALNENDAARLWAFTEAELGQKFDLNQPC